MSTEENKAIMRRYLEEAWGNQDWSVVDEVVAEDAVFHDQVREGGQPGRANLRAVMDNMFTGAPDLQMNIHDMIAEGDLVAVRFSSTGSHTGDFNGIPPTGRPVRFDGIAIVRFEDGRIIEGWQEADRMGLAQQLGVMPKGEMPRPVARALVGIIRLKDRLSRRRALRSPGT